MGKQTVWEEIDKKSAEILEASDQIWGCAETAFTEHQSMKVLCELLRKEGFQVEEGLAGVETAFKGTFGSGKPVIGFLGEFDALSGLDQEAGATEKKQLHAGAPGHGCGHNMLGAASLSAALGLKRYLEETKKSGTVVYFGCPGEEGGSGKAFMAKGGAFSGLDAAITWHPGDLTRADTGSSLANYQVAYKFYGTSAMQAEPPSGKERPGCSGVNEHGRSVPPGACGPRGQDPLRHHKHRRLFPQCGAALCRGALSDPCAKE